ncbi:22614_t:CDS:1, partial [Rhizophagus irregularis]
SRVVRQEQYINIIDLDKVTEHRINGKSLLETLGIALRKVPLTQPTDINRTVM